jgi:hemoglobin
MKKDIVNRDDIFRLVKEFYVKLLADPSISYIFTDVAKTDLSHHLPVLVDFWDMILFQSNTYQKNAMRPHMELNEQTPFTKQHFETWLKHFTTTVDESFEGEKAFLAKERALSIEPVMQIKIAQLNPFKK